jgi:hypothetical protein
MKRIRKVALVSGIAGALALGGGVAVAQTSVFTGSAQAAQDPVSVVNSVIIPPPLAVPAGQQLVAKMEVERGSQVYTCTSGAYTLLEPAAVLGSGNQLVLHTRGPEWVSANDGSAVVGAVVASVPRPNAVPELLLRSTSNRGTGLFGQVDYIQRLETVGGVAPTGACTDGSQVAVPYHAQYRFYVPAGSQKS